MKYFSCAVLACLLAVGGAYAGERASSDPIAAVWKQQQIDFHYFGRTSRYTCDGLRDKVRALLLQLGARRDLRLTASGCYDSQFRDLATGLTLVFSVPMPASPALVAAHPKDLASVTAKYVPFRLQRDAFRNLDVGDCELVEEVAAQILPKLSIRGLHKEVTCIPHQLSGSSYVVYGSVLKAADHTD